MESIQKTNRKLFFRGIINNQEHAFHIVESSFLPFLSSMFILCVLLNLVSYLHEIKLFLVQSWTIILIQIIFVSVILYWFNTITIESMRGFHTTKIQIGLRYGVLLFIVSEIMFFFAFFWVFFHFTGTFNIIGLVLPVINTTLLLSSGITITLAHTYIIKKRQLPLILNPFFGIILGFFLFIFVCSEPILCNNGPSICIGFMIDNAGDLDLFVGCKQNLVYNPTLNADLQFQGLYNINQHLYKYGWFIELKSSNYRLGNIIENMVLVDSSFDSQPGNNSKVYLENWDWNWEEFHKIYLTKKTNVERSRTMLEVLKTYRKREYISTFRMPEFEDDLYGDG